MQRDNSRIPRWFVENDPSWERSIDSDLGILRWIKKGTQIRAVCHPASMFCEIIGQTNQASDDLSYLVAKGLKERVASVGSEVDEVKKYLSSRYLNPGIYDLPRFDLKKISK
jgi:hypothetical protein